MNRREVASIHTSTLRLLWMVVEETQTRDLLKLSDLELVQQLISQLHSKKMLSRDETHCVNEYLRSKILLIRELAQMRPSYVGDFQA